MLMPSKDDYKKENMKRGMNAKDAEKAAAAQKATEAGHPVMGGRSEGS
jgi:hypothetical protein